MLKNIKFVVADSVIYKSPYSKFHYYGKVMIGVESKSPYAKLGERKIVTKLALQHHGAPKRGPFWDKRMWADKKNKIVKVVAKAAGGEAK